MSERELLFLVVGILIGALVVLEGASILGLILLLLVIVLLFALVGRVHFPRR